MADSDTRIRKLDARDLRLRRGVRAQADAIALQAELARSSSAYTRSTAAAADAATAAAATSHTRRRREPLLPVAYWIVFMILVAATIVSVMMVLGSRRELTGTYVRIERTSTRIRSVPHTSHCMYERSGRRARSYRGCTLATTRTWSTSPSSSSTTSRTS